jgi:carbon-monoxide dehydrogenase medium subunit
MLHRFEYLAPRDPGELLKALAERPDAKLLAGGTDLIPNIRVGVFKPSLVIDLKRLPGADEIRVDADGLHMGPAVTINQAMRHPAVRESFPLICSGAHELASHQIRNRATVVGNVANASPCADMAPALLCLGAMARIRSSAGTREVSFVEFFTGVKKTCLKAGEYVEAIVLPSASAGMRGDYRKLKRIKGHDLGVVGVMLARSASETRIAVSSAAPTPILVAGLPANSGEDEVASKALAAISPIDDVRATAEYRRFMVETYARVLAREVR